MVLMLVVDLSDEVRRVAGNNSVFLDGPRNDAACADKSVLPDRDTRQDRRVGPDLGPFFHDGTLEPLLDHRGPRVFGIGQNHVRSDPAPPA